jgi:hypothetical protein
MIFQDYMGKTIALGGIARSPRHASYITYTSEPPVIYVLRNYAACPLNKTSHVRKTMEQYPNININIFTG